VNDRASPTPPFLHRKDCFGGHLSFCTTCFQTVAESSSEQALADGEERHRCQGLPLNLLHPRPQDKKSGSD
jgi:hypothetical protein